MNNIAAPWKRLVAFIIDQGLSFAVVLIILLRITGANDVAGVMDNLLNLVFYFIFGSALYGLFNIWLTSKAGGSIGKLITGIRVVNPEGKYISFSKASMRNYVGYFVSGTPVWLGFIWILKDEKRRAWHDMIADTLVVDNGHNGKAIPGIILMLAVIFGCGWLLGQVVNQATGRRHMYQEIFTDIQYELEPTPTKAPLEYTGFVKSESGL